MKPQDLFLSLREFFAIFVPGAVAIYAFIALNRPTLPNIDLVPGAQTLLVAAAAYGVGNVLYAAGALLDGWYAKVERRLMRGSREKRFEIFEQVATAARKEAISKLPEAGSDLAKSWSNRSFWSDQLRYACPVGSAELDRLESTQKFFRTFTVLLLLAGVNAIVTKEWAPAAIAVAAMAICLGFYAQRRAEWTYRMHKWVFLTLMNKDAANDRKVETNKTAVA